MAIRLPITVACSRVSPALTHLEVERGEGCCERGGEGKEAEGRGGRGPQETCHSTAPLINPI